MEYLQILGSGEKLVGSLNGINTGCEGEILEDFGWLAMFGEDKSLGLMISESSLGASMFIMNLGDCSGETR